MAVYIVWAVPVAVYIGVYFRARSEVPTPAAREMGPLNRAVRIYLIDSRAKLVNRE